MTQGFLRVHYMKDGDFLLLGPKRYQDAFGSRVFHTGFLWMPADLSKAPVWIGEEHYEGVAVSRESRKIAYTKTWADTAFHYPSALYVAELTKDGKIVNSKAVYRSPQLIEAQDFLPGDRGVTFTRYTPTYEAYGIDLSTKQVTDYSLSPASEEVEGIFPDGAWTLMESDRHARKTGDMDLDIYMLKLDGAGKNVRRLTNFSDTPGQKASNPVVSPEGCRIAFMKSVQAETTRFMTGAGAGIFLLEFYDCKQ
jgi:Tol biopolymer transport system component